MKSSLYKLGSAKSDKVFKVAIMWSTFFSTRLLARVQPNGTDWLKRKKKSKSSFTIWNKTTLQSDNTDNTWPTGKITSVISCAQKNNQKAFIWFPFMTILTVATSWNLFFFGGSFPYGFQVILNLHKYQCYMHTQQVLQFISLWQKLM